MMRSPKRMAEIEAKLEGPGLPAAVQHIWGWFREISLGRQPGSFGPAGLTYLDIQAWSQMTRRVLLPCEVSAILYVDRVWLSVQAGDKPKAPATGGGKSGNKR